MKLEKQAFREGGKLSLVAALSAACSLFVQAKTIALWPMEQDTMANAVDTRCAIDPANDLINLKPAQLKTVEQTVGWNLPPNPDVSADLYDPLTMPPDLRAAHTANDRAVLAAYGLAPDTPEPEIVAYLFKLYVEMTEETKR